LSSRALADNPAMPGTDYDIVIVGARCAGATLATFLARSGARVLLLDAHAMPSDHVISTHSINPPGMDVLDELGVGDRVRAIAPPSRIIRSVFEETCGEIEMPEGRAIYGPRRHRLDELLQHAAVSAGAHLMDRTRAVSLLYDGDRVRGVRTNCGGRDREFTAGLVVGADGRHSSVARWVGAEEYLGYDAPRACYWGYWNAPGFWKTDPAYRFDMYFSIIKGVVRIIFQTDHDQLLVGTCPPADRIDAWRSDPSGMLEAVLAGDPTIAPLIQASPREGKVRGTIRERYYFRRAAGNGWALVGDAGHHKDFAVGDGITEALLQARSLAGAIAVGTDAALVHWWRARDVAALPMYFMGREIGDIKPPVELQRIVFDRLNTVPGLKERLVEVIERRLSPLDSISALQFLRWVGLAALQGRWGVFEELRVAAPRAVATTLEMRARTRLLARAESEIARENRAAA